MAFFSKFLGDKGVKAYYGVLTELSYSDDSEAFQKVKQMLEKLPPETITKSLDEGYNPREIAHYYIREFTMNMLISGDYHLTRGKLNPLGPGKDIVRLYNQSVDYLVGSNFLSKEEGDSDHTYILECVRDSG